MGVAGVAARIEAGATGEEVSDAELLGLRADVAAALSIATDELTR